MSRNNFLVLWFVRWRKRHQKEPACHHGELTPRGWFQADRAYWCGAGHCFDGGDWLTCPCGSEEVMPAYRPLAIAPTRLPWLPRWSRVRGVIPT
jgi:hypothetical protein